MASLILASAPHSHGSPVAPTGRGRTTPLARRHQKSRGRAAIAAALKPAQAEFIYFVARPDGSGRHIFSKSYSDHARAVAAWRRVKG